MFALGLWKSAFNNINLVKHYETLGQFKICAITSRNLSYKRFSDYPCILSSNLNHYDYDVIIIMSYNYVSSIIEDALSMVFSEINNHSC